MNQQRQFKSLVQQPQSSPPQPPMWNPYQGAPPVQVAEMPSEIRRYQPQGTPAQSEHQSICRRCGREFGFLDRLGHDKKDHYCRTCSNQISQSLQLFRAKFLEVTRYGSLNSTDWMALQSLAAQERLDMQEALAFICKDAVGLIERSAAQAEANGGITGEKERYILHLLKILAIPNEVALPILQRLTYSKQRTSIQRFNQTVMQAEAQSSIAGETIQRIYDLQKALAIPDEVAQPAFQWLVASKQRKNIQIFNQAVAQAKAEDDITDEPLRRIFELQKALAIPDEVARPAFQQLAQARKSKKVQRFNQAVAQAEAEDDITYETIQRISDLQRALTIPDEVARPAFQRLAYLKELTDIRRGDLPTVSTSVELESDELCHLETPATYHKVNARSSTRIFGRLVATNKKLHFLSSTRSFSLSWSTIMLIEIRSHPELHDCVYLELSKGTGNGFYAVDDPKLVEAVLSTLVKKSKRQILGMKADADRYIPQDVRHAVYQRDGGKCVQCGADSYLEYDHIIPHSKGGANSVANVQLLCRSCNLKKSDRI